MNLPTGITLTILLLAGNGFFVAAEFALVAAKRPRLEKAAASGSRGAASAVAGIRELTLMLAGAQLGITICSLGLGVVSEPVFAETLTPLFHSVGLPEGGAHAVAFVLALALVTFLHMVIGEMAPKSWALVAPERSAALLAPSFRGFTKLVRPVLTTLNGFTNALLRLVRVQPRDEMSISRTPEQLQHLVEESRRLGLIEESDRRLLGRALRAPQDSLTGLLVPLADIATVPHDAVPETVMETADRTGHTRLLVRADDGRLTGLIHARDAYLAHARGERVRAADLAHTVPTLDAAASMAAAMTTLRNHHSQLGLVNDRGGKLIGLVALDDLLHRLLAVA
ncbi:hemolysin family protein [Actinomadura napierensis]|uniref:Hemolysin family protein n=1 Tax=Actinomadura napierensis TaxID=267854 RepID=A0ABN2YE81_9ACTN